MKKMARYIGWCLLTFIPLGIYGQITANPFALQSVSQTVTEIISQTFQNNGLHTVNLSQANPVYGVAVSGHVAFHNANNSMVRVTAVCADGMEYLVYETSPLLSEGQDFDIEDVAMETAVLDAENIVRLNVMLVNATFNIFNVKYNRDAIPNMPQRKNAIAVDQEEALIARLNENLEKQGHLWRAGKTSLSSMTYEQKKAIFGDTVPYLGGFEYYVGGIFVMPEYTPQTSLQSKSSSDDRYVNEWDWRNQHGKNWITSVKNQWSCGSCWAFAVAGAIEAYINLYYNKLIKYDLSEQQLVSCFADNGCNGANPGLTLNYIRKNGIVLESCFPYKAQNVSCSNICSNESERIYIDNYSEINPNYDTEEEVKKNLLRAPLCFGIRTWNHEMLLVGYKVIKEGDEIYTSNNTKVIIKKGDARIGSTAWLLKNSWGESFGKKGYAYVVTNWKDTYCINTISGSIKSKILTDNDIVVSDADGDGFYFWGIGNRPSFLPDWVPMEPDGNDSDPTKGAMDDYGNLKPSGKIKNVRTNTTWTSLSECLPIVFVEKGATLTLKGNMCLYPDSRILVKEGGSLILDGVTLECASIKVYNGGYIKVMNGAILRREESDIFEVESGGLMDWLEGSIVEK